MKKLNINSMVSMILTQKGADILNEQNLDLVKKFPDIVDTLKMNYYSEGDLFECQLWTMLNKFGKCLKLGGESPITNCEIFIDEKYLEGK